MLIATQTDLIETHIAPLQEKPIRLQEYAVGIFKTITTKSALKKALKKERILVNGQIATTATLIKGNEKIVLHKGIEIDTHKEFIYPLEVVYEDEYLAIIYKPAGVLTSGNSFKTIANALPQNLRNSERADAVKPQPVHRLDYPTTGLLLVGKTSAGILALNRLFEKKEIEKIYFAITIGEMKTQEGTVSQPIDDKNAISHYQVLQRVASKRFNYLNLVRLSPKTGRKHQLRKHLASLRNPVLGDAAYGIENLILKGKGLYLHAFSLAFEHPFTEEKVYFEKELPQKFMKLFNVTELL